MTPEQIEQIYKPGWRWGGRSLENYKAMHRAQAEEQGKGPALAAVKTLTAARKLIFGYKKKNTR